MMLSHKVKNIKYLSHDIAFGSDIRPCIKINKPLVVISQYFKVLLVSYD